MPSLSSVLQNAQYRRALIFTLPLTAQVLVIMAGIYLSGSQQFSLLAQAFLHGQLNFLHPIGGLGQDPIFYHGKIYWGEGPLPAVLLMPFVAIFNIFNAFFYQKYLFWPLTLGVMYFIYQLARSIKYSKEDSLILVLGFTLGSVFIGVSAVSSSWFFAQMLNTFLIFWALYEYYVHENKRWWLVGIITALVMMTRITSAPLIIFFILEAWSLYGKYKVKLKKLAQIVIPAAVAVLLLGLYNFLRFHNPLNGGFKHQLLYEPSAAARAQGVFSPLHLPTDLYSMLLRGPLGVLSSNSTWTLKFPFIESNPYGMSIFVTSPYLLHLFTNKWSSFDKRSRHLLLAALLSALFVACYYGLGLQQYGYRYSLDFLPEIYVLFMIMYRKRHNRLSRGMKLLLLGSGLFNLYLAAPVVV